jgi:hypothetical protein
MYASLYAVEFTASLSWFLLQWFNTDHFNDILVTKVEKNSMV